MRIEFKMYHNQKDAPSVAFVPVSPLINYRLRDVRKAIRVLEGFTSDELNKFLEDHGLGRVELGERRK